MSTKGALPVLLLGAGHRARSIYVPLLQSTLCDRIELVGIVSRGTQRLQDLASEASVPGWLDLDEALRASGARAAIVCVSPQENGIVATQVIDRKLPALLETPLALQVDEARSLLTRCESSGLPIEVAEQNPRFPLHRFRKLLVDEGHLGTVRAVSSDLNGYRYHAAAVARSLLSRPQARWAVGQSARFDSDFGRGCGPERLVAGGIETVGGALFTLRDGEAGHLGTGPWARGRWHLYGERGGVFGDQQCVGWSPSGPTEHRIIWEHGNGPAGDAIQSVRLEGFPALRWESPLPEAALDADALAVATCILDWLARIDGQKSDSAWSPRDAFLDLVWTEAVERSASLGGIRIRVSAVRDDKEPPEGG